MPEHLGYIYQNITSQRAHPGSIKVLTLGNRDTIVLPSIPWNRQGPLRRNQDTIATMSESQGTADPRAAISPPPLSRPPRLLQQSWPSRRVPFFTPEQDDPSEMQDYARSRGIKCNHYMPCFMAVDIALWEFSVPSDDPLRARLQELVAKPTFKIMIDSCGVSPTNLDTYSGMPLADIAGSWGPRHARPAAATLFVERVMKQRAAGGTRFFPCHRVTFFTPRHDRNTAREYASERKLPTGWYNAEETLVAIALWDFELPLDDPLRDELLRLTKMTLNEIKTYTRFNYGYSGGDCTRAGVATWFMEHEVEKRGSGKREDRAVPGNRSTTV